MTTPSDGHEARRWTRPQSGFQPHESIWACLQKIRALNFALERDLQIALTIPGRRATARRWTQSDSDLSTSKGFHRPALLEMLGGEDSDLERRFASSYHILNLEPSATFNRNLYHQHVRICQPCLMHGWHWPLFQLVGVVACPVHRDRPLLDGCPTCGKRIPHRFTGVVDAQPFHCPSGHNLWPGLDTELRSPGVAPIDGVWFEKFECSLRVVRDPYGEQIRDPFIEIHGGADKALQCRIGPMRAWHVYPSFGENRSVFGEPWESWDDVEILPHRHASVVGTGGDPHHRIKAMRAKARRYGLNGSEPRGDSSGNTGLPVDEMTLFVTIVLNDCWRRILCRLLRHHRKCLLPSTAMAAGMSAFDRELACNAVSAFMLWRTILYGREARTDESRSRYFRYFKCFREGLHIALQVTLAQRIENAAYALARDLRHRTVILDDGENLEDTVYEFVECLAQVIAYTAFQRVLDWGFGEKERFLYSPRLWPLDGLLAGHIPFFHFSCSRRIRLTVERTAVREAAELRWVPAPSGPRVHHASGGS